MIRLLGAIVHFMERPGVVEDKYGPATPYILKKLGWSMLTRNLGLGAADVNPGYGVIKDLLVERALMRPDDSLHIGATHIELAEDKTMYGSASGTLVRPEIDAWFQEDKYYANRADEDAQAGLYDWENDRRAGLYDVSFAEQVMFALNDGIESLAGTRFYKPLPHYYEGIDIN